MYSGKTIKIKYQAKAQFELFPQLIFLVEKIAFLPYYIKETITIKNIYKYSWHKK